MVDTLSCIVLRIFVPVSIRYCTRGTACAFFSGLECGVEKTPGYLCGNISLRGDASLPSHPFFAHCKSSNRRVSPRSPHVASTTSGAAHLKHFPHRSSVALRAWDVLTEGCVDGRLRWLFAVKSRQRIGCRGTLSWSSPSCPPSERLTPTPPGAMFFYRTGDMA